MKKYFDELCDDERLVDAESHYKNSVFYANLDIVILQLSARFEGLQTVTKHFRCIHPTALASDKDDVLYQAAFELANINSAKFSSNFPCLLLSFRQILRGEISKLDTLKDLAELVIIKHVSIMTSIADVSVAFKLFLTLPVTVASAERSFSKLKLIKSFLRSTLAQGRLSGLSMLSIENIRARNLNLSYRVKRFPESNAKRKKRFSTRGY